MGVSSDNAVESQADLPPKKPADGHPQAFSGARRNFSDFSRPISPVMMNNDTGRLCRVGPIRERAMRIRRLFISGITVALSLCAGLVAHAASPTTQTSTWTNGGGNSNWNTASNWSPSGVPNNGLFTYAVDYGVNSNLVEITVTSVPEPSGMALLALSGLLLLRRFPAKRADKSF
jgi:hypothetical protein